MFAVKKNSRANESLLASGFAKGGEFALSLVVALFWLCTVDVFSNALHAQNQDRSLSVAPLPQFIHTTIKGLDHRNRIDQLIGRYGFICEKNYLSKGPCGFEVRLTNYLKTLPPTREDIASELSRLGAMCRRNPERVHCIYERQVENSAWKADSSEPVSVHMEFFQVDVVITGDDGSLSYESRLSRKTEVKK